MEQKLRRDRWMGANLKKMRLSHKLSQEKLCVKLQMLGCDIGRTTYEKYESGELNIRISVVLALKEVYGCTFDAFFEGLTIHTEEE
ncbi:MAG: helix-turn-helix transcriptional regulator [Eubacteriales bacterium]|nr:helix-turn-helix transcriptional regulator [Eubacteriales bacterium]